jgi:hypothetical protein
MTARTRVCQARVKAQASDIKGRDGVPDAERKQPEGAGLGPQPGHPVEDGREQDRHDHGKGERGEQHRQEVG